jgi:hypothetical protein
VGLTTGCITIAGNNLSDVEPQPSETLSGVEQTVGDFSFHLDGGKMVTSNKLGRIVNDEVLNRWVELGFTESHRYVKSSQFTEASSYQITLQGHQEGESSIFLQVISGLTLTVIPYYVDTRMEIIYSVHHSPSGCTYAASVSDSYNTIVGLLMLPLSPFGQSGRARTFDRIAKTLYEQLDSEGAFAKHRSCMDEEETKAIPESPAGSSGTKPSTEERLEGLERLRSRGLVTSEEFERKRKEILDDL